MKVKQLRHAVLLAMVLSCFTGAAKAACELIPIKNQNFGGLELIRACSILPFLAIQPEGPDICSGLPVTGPQEPLVDLVAHDMLYFNWEIPAESVLPLETALGLRDRGFRLAPIAIIRDASPKYYMSLNFYSVSIAGVVNYRTEWSIYVVKEGDPKPRYMVVQVQSSEDAADPTAPGFTNPGTDVTYSIDNGQAWASSPDFEAHFSLPGGDRETTRVDFAWAESIHCAYSLAWHGRHDSAPR